MKAPSVYVDITRDGYGDDIVVRDSKGNPLLKMWDGSARSEKLAHTIAYALNAHAQRTRPAKNPRCRICRSRKALPHNDGRCGHLECVPF
jgi:hypothetical protein